MSKSFFESQLISLKDDLMEMGGAVEEMLSEALKALATGDADLARESILRDKGINAREIKIIDKTVLLIATNQPVARDLRFLAASLRLAGELERVGDITANLGRRAQRLVELNQPRPLPDDLTAMISQARRMISETLDAFARSDIDLATKVLEEDDIVDDLNSKVRKGVLADIEKDGSLVHWGLEIIFTAAHLERLGDHATNLCEEVIYIGSGKNIRHSHQIWEREREAELKG